MLFAPGGIDREQAGTAADSLDAWGAAGREVADRLAATYELWEPVAPARALASACSVGAGACRALASGVPIDDARLSSDLAALDRAAEPNGSATELPVLGPIRTLVAAAARQGSRPGQTADAWHALVLSTAFPEAPAGASR